MGRQDYETETLIAHSLRAQSQLSHREDQDTLVPVSFGWQASPQQSMNPSELSPSLDKSKTPAVAFTVSGPSGGFAWEKPYASAVMATPPSDTANTQTGIRIGSAVRRLTPTECERLQGFPDDYTAVPYRGKPAADGPRYKALGNSMAVPVMAWIGSRIAQVEALQSQSLAA